MSSTEQVRKINKSFKVSAPLDGDMTEKIKCYYRTVLKNGRAMKERVLLYE